MVKKNSASNDLAYVPRFSPYQISKRSLSPVVDALYSIQILTHDGPGRT
jgi:hypothetical protein